MLPLVLLLHGSPSSAETAAPAGRYKMTPVADSRTTVDGRTIPRCSDAADAALKKESATAEVVFDGKSQVLVNSLLWSFESSDETMAIATYELESKVTLEVWFWRSGSVAHGFMKVSESDGSGQLVCGHGKQMRGGFRRRPLSK
jgi:hypothetical protein